MTKKLNPLQVSTIDKVIARYGASNLEMVIRQDATTYTAGARVLNSGATEPPFIALFTFELPMPLSDFASLCKQIEARLKKAKKTR